MRYENDIKDRTRKFAVRIVKLSSELKKNCVDFPLVNQILRSGTSIGANVAEGKASSTKRELIRYYEIALRSSNETIYWMDVIKEGYDLKNEIFTTDERELKEISKVLGAIVVNLKN